MAAPNRYRICGLHLASAIPFPELRALAGAGAGAGDGNGADIELAPARAEVPVQRGAVVMTTEQPDGTPWLVCTRTGSGYRFEFPDYADFFADRAGRRVTCAARPDTPPETVRHLFLDQVMPLLLNLRGTESLHGSAVRAADGVCAFIGKSRQGKSTLAAAFQKIGNAAYCDDCLLVHAKGNCVRVERAYPGLRLWDDSRGALFGDNAGGMPVSHYSTKVRVATLDTEDAESGMLELRAVYALHLDDDGGTLKVPVIELLSMRDGLMALIEYAFRLDLSDRDMILRQMEIFERVVRTVPVRRLRLPHDLSALQAARDLVLRDLVHG